MSADFESQYPKPKTFECHITVDLGKDHGSVLLSMLEKCGEKNGWKTSYIQNDPVLGNKPYFYFTKHGREYADLFNKMKDMKDVLRGAWDLNVVREKIEAIVYDTKMGDT